MTRRQTQLPLKDAVAHLLKEHSISQRTLARELDISQGWLSRALSGDRPFPPELFERLARLLDVEPNHFIEYRRASLIQAIDRDPALLDRLYRQLPSKALHRR